MSARRRAACSGECLSIGRGSSIIADRVDPVAGELEVTDLAGDMARSAPSVPAPGRDRASVRGRRGGPGTLGNDAPTISGALSLSGSRSRGKWLTFCGTRGGPEGRGATVTGPSGAPPG